MKAFVPISLLHIILSIKNLKMYQMSSAFSGVLESSNAILTMEHTKNKWLITMHIVSKWHIKVIEMKGTSRSSRHFNVMPPNWKLLSGTTALYLKRSSLNHTQAPCSWSLICPHSESHKWLMSACWGRSTEDELSAVGPALSMQGSDSASSVLCKTYSRHHHQCHVIISLIENTMNAVCQNVKINCVNDANTQNKNSKTTAKDVSPNINWTQAGEITSRQQRNGPICCCLTLFAASTL